MIIFNREDIIYQIAEDAGGAGGQRSRGEGEK
jgi:hypothetical protein